MVTVPSGAIRTQALISFALCAFASEISCRPSTPTAMANATPPLDLRNVLREIFISGLLRRALDGGSDALVRPAAADVAVHVLDDVFARGLRVGGKQFSRLHDLAGLAVAALRNFLGDPCLLKRMRRVGREPFDRRDARILYRSERGCARAHGLA